MNPLLAKCAAYWAYPFVRHALLAGTAIALCSSLLGVVLVLRRFSYIGDALSHVAFGAMALAAVLGLHNHLPLTLPLTMALAIPLLALEGRSALRSDAALAMLAVGAIAVGYFLLNLFPPASPNLSGDVCSALFGSTSILTLSTPDVAICLAFSLTTTTLFLLFHRLIFALTFDPTFAAASGLPTRRFTLLFSTIVAGAVVMAMKLVGAMLAAALIVFPALSALALARSFTGVLLLSASFALLCTFAGILTALLAGTPVGATIVVAQILLFALVRLLAPFTRKSS